MALTIAVNGDPIAPDPGAVLGTSSMQVSLRPFRRALLVTQNDREGLKRAILAASTIWGGMRTPIITVTNGSRLAPAWEQIASYLCVDQVVDFRRSRRRSLDLSGLGSSQVGLIPERPLTDGHYWNPHPIAAISAIDLEQRRVLVGSASSLVRLAALGEVALPEERTMWQERGAKLIEAHTPADVAWAQVKAESVLDCTAVQDVDRTISGPMMTSIAMVVVAEDDDDFESVVAYWNLRALRPRSFNDGASLLITRAMADDPGVINAIQHAASLATCEPTLTLLSSTVSRQWLEARIARWGLTKHTSTKITDRILGAGPAGRPLTARQLDPRAGWLVDRNPGETASVPVAWERPRTRALFDSPVRWNHGNVGVSRVEVVLRAEQFNVPRRPAVAKLFHQSAEWEGDGLRIGTTANGRYDFALGLPTGGDVLGAALQESETTVQPSDKAVQIQGALAAVSDPAMLRDRTVLAAILALTTPANRDLTRLLGSSSMSSDDQIAAVVAAVGPAQGLQFSAIVGKAGVGVSRSRLSAALSRLVGDGVVERGFQTKCSLCGLRLFTPLSAASASPTCAGCGHAAVLVGDGMGEPTLHYRLGSLAHRLSLNGGLAAAAGMQALRALNAYVLPGANIHHLGAPDGELDLVGWRGNTVFAGESKSSADGFEKHDIVADVARVKRIGADEYVMVCFEALTSASRDLAERACLSAGLTLLVLDGDSLFNDIVL